MFRFFVLIMIVLFGVPALAQPPEYGERPAEGRTTGYWATVEKVVDVDTYWADGVKYREAGIDGPELNRAECDAELFLARIGTDRATSMLLGNKVWIQPTGRWDQYDRPVVKTRIGWALWYAETMKGDLLAVTYKGRQHDWCGVKSGE